MKKPIILITGGCAYDYQFHSESLILYKNYSAAIVAAGGLPIMPLDMNNVEEYVDIADGCVFTGTCRISPDPSLSFDELQSKRIKDELVLMKMFVETGKPVLGICQGFQQLNVAFGGTLNIDFKLTEGVEHNRSEHKVKTAEGTLINKMFGKEFLVNSFHNVRIEKLSSDFVASAISPDGVIEAIEHKTKPVLALQWHPERMRGDFPDPATGPDMEKIFEWFISECRK